MDLKIKRKDKSIILPKYETVGSSGLDLRAYLPEGDEILTHGQFKIIPTGLFVELSGNTEIQIRPRSGLVAKNGVTVLNSPGTIDSDYRGEIGVILINHGQHPFIIKNGDRIAQMVVSSVIKVDVVENKILTETARGEKGFGSTGSL